MEDPENIYAAPATNPEVPQPENQPANFADIPWKELKKLRNDSHSIRAIGFLFGLGLLIAIGGLLFTITSGEELFIPAAVIGPLIIGAAVWICFWRPRYGNVFGLIICMLITAGALIGAAWIGILLGILGCVAFARGKQLFGPNRYKHGDLEREYKHRKRNKIFD